MPRTSLPPRGVEVRESEEAAGDGRPAGGEPGGARGVASQRHGRLRSLL